MEVSLVIFFVVCDILCVGRLTREGHVRADVRQRHFRFPFIIVIYCLDKCYLEIYYLRNGRRLLFRGKFTLSSSIVNLLYGNYPD